MVKKGMVRGMEIMGAISDTSPCKPCLIIRVSRQKTTETDADKILGHVHWYTILDIEPIHDGAERQNLCAKLCYSEHLPVQPFA
jgi:hypothetical protein